MITMDRLPFKRSTHPIRGGQPQYVIGMEKSKKEYVLPDDLLLKSSSGVFYTIPKGTKILIFCTQNAGWVKTPDIGHPQTLFNDLY